MNCLKNTIPMYLRSLKRKLQRDSSSPWALCMLSRTAIYPQRKVLSVSVCTVSIISVRNSAKQLTTAGSPMFSATVGFCRRFSKKAAWITLFQTKCPPGTIQTVSPTTTLSGRVLTEARFMPAYRLPTL